MVCGVGDVQMPQAMGMYNYGGYGPGHLPGPMSYSVVAPYRSRIPPQGLSPHQQMIEANLMAAEIKKMQYYPNQEQDESKCSMM